MQTQDFVEQEPALRQALTGWWATQQTVQQARPRPHHLSDHTELQRLMQEATSAYASVAGWSKQADVRRPRVLPGHHKLRRELDALYAFRRAVQRTLDQCTQADVSPLQDSMMTAQQRDILRRQVLPRTLPARQVA